jgi:hypothetical protein
MKMGMIASTMIALAAAGFALAPVAVATPESQFLDELGTLNITLPGKSPADTVAAGYAACGDLRNGASVLDEMSAVEKRYNFNQGTLFVSAATTNLCPNFAG